MATKAKRTQTTPVSRSTFGWTAARNVALSCKGQAGGAKGWYLKTSFPAPVRLPELGPLPQVGG